MGIQTRREHLKDYREMHNGADPRRAQNNGAQNHSVFRRHKLSCIFMCPACIITVVQMCI